PNLSESSGRTSHQLDRPTIFAIHRLLRACTCDGRRSYGMIGHLLRGESVFGETLPGCRCHKTRRHPGRESGRHSFVASRRSTQAARGLSSRSASLAKLCAPRRESPRRTWAPRNRNVSPRRTTPVVGQLSVLAVRHAGANIHPPKGLLRR